MLKVLVIDRCEYCDCEAYVYGGEYKDEYEERPVYLPCQPILDVYSLQKLMGHADLQVLRRYLAQTTEDIAAAHRVGSPVDNNQF